MIAAKISRQALHRTFCRALSLQTRSIASSVRTVVWKPSAESEKEIEECYGRLDLKFENGKEAFKSKTNYELFRALIVLHLCSCETLVKNNSAILKALRRSLGQNLFNKLLRATFFGQFVAGETREEVEPTVWKMQKFGVKSILDYSVEKDISEEEVQKRAFERMADGGQIKNASLEQVIDAKTVAKTHRKYNVYKEFADRRQNVISARTYFYDGEVECDRNCDIFCQSIDAVASATGGLGFCAIKVTALGRPALLLKASESIAQTQNFFKAITGSTWENLVLSKINEKEFAQKIQDYGIKTESKMVQKWFNMVDFDEDGFVDFYDWTHLLDENIKLSEMFQVYNIKTQKIEPLIVELSDGEEQEFANMTDRIVQIVDYAISKGVRVMIDAEQTYFQPAISRITMALMRKHNKERGWVFNTYQAYLKNCLRDVELDLHIARRGNFHFGCKLVRGAYMNQERKRAATVGYEDPINPNIEATAEMYNRVLTRIVEERDVRGPGQCSVMVASHNEESTRFAVQLMKDKCIAPSEKVICFAQLFGMCDQISFSLGQAGYSVYKYVPYGPIEDVLPYLSRRAQENGSLLLKAKKERKLLRNELMRRICTGQWIYNAPNSTNFTVQ